MVVVVGTHQRDAALASATDPTGGSIAPVADNETEQAGASKAPAFGVTTDDQLDTYDTYGPLPPPADDVPVMPKYTCRP
jgi:hypothetical protein